MAGGDISLPTVQVAFPPSTCRLRHGTLSVLCIFPSYYSSSALSSCVAGISKLAFSEYMNSDPSHRSTILFELEKFLDLYWLLISTNSWLGPCAPSWPLFIPLDSSEPSLHPHGVLTGVTVLGQESRHLCICGQLDTFVFRIDLLVHSYEDPVSLWLVGVLRPPEVNSHSPLSFHGTCLEMSVNPVSPR